jgi:hypothetical protein
MRAQVKVGCLGMCLWYVGYGRGMVRPSFNGQVQAVRLPTPTSPDNPFKPETSNVSPGSSVESVYEWFPSTLLLFIVLSGLETFPLASYSTSVGNNQSTVSKGAVPSLRSRIPLATTHAALTELYQDGI